MFASTSQDGPHRELTPEAVAAQMLAAKPSRNHDDMVAQSFSLQHPQDHHARTCLTIIVLQWGIGNQQSPCIM